MEFTTNYLFESNVRTINGDKQEMASQILGYDTLKAAEIKYFEEVAYGLKLNNIVLAHYQVTDEYGSLVNNLMKTIDNTNTPDIVSK